MASVSLIASTREECDVASPLVTRRRGWVGRGDGGVEGVGGKAVTWCCLLRHAVRAAEPTRPKKGVRSVLYCFGGARMRTCGTNNEDLHGWVCESLQIIEIIAREAIINTLVVEAHIKGGARTKLRPSFAGSRRCVGGGFVRCICGLLPF